MFYYNIFNLKFFNLQNWPFCQFEGEIYKQCTFYRWWNTIFSVLREFTAF